MTRGLAGMATLLLAASLTGSCAGSSSSDAAPMAVSESPAARARIDGLRARFVFPAALPPVGFGAATPAPAQPRPALVESVASGFELRDGVLHPVIVADAKGGGTRTASVTLPVHARDAVRLEDDSSHLSVSFALRGASDAAITTAAGIALYPGALAGADVLHRVHAEGTEDYVVFEQRPAKEEIAYDLDVSRVAGLRLVSNTLEFLDAGGAPRLRVAPPYVIDANGRRSEAVLSLDGCAFDASPRAPWIRAVTSPGSSRCAVRVAWRAATYPAMVDPSWTATGSMATPRYIHTATLLGSGAVLVTGGVASSSGPSTSAKLYDPTTRTFASTGAMASSRYYHTATLLSSGQVLVASGAMDGSQDPTSSAELYDPTAGTFSPTGSLVAARSEHTATLLGSGKVLMAGGYGAKPSATDDLSSAELYDPVTGTFTLTGSLTTARANHAATILGTGKVLFVGGDNYGACLSSAELFDPTAGTFTATGSMTTERSIPSAALLGSGEVLVAGGATGCTTMGYSAASSAELYDPTSGTFAPTGSMTTGRLSHRATLLGSGEVLVTGGSPDNRASLSSAELFTCTAMCPATYNCGTVAACDGTLVSCGTCTAPQTCGGGADGGTPNVCGCAPTACASSCGTMPNGCGGSVDCGGCAPGDACTNNKCVAGGTDGGADSGRLGVDASADSGAIGTDSGSVDTGTSDASDGGGAGGGSGQSSGCSCHTAQRQDVPSYGLLWLGAVGLVRIRRRRRSTGRGIGR